MKNWTSDLAWQARQSTAARSGGRPSSHSGNANLAIDENDNIKASPSAAGECRLVCQHWHLHNHQISNASWQSMQLIGCMHLHRFCMHESMA
jgi:hypothetical protein